MKIVNKDKTIEQEPHYYRSNYWNDYYNLIGVLDYSADKNTNQ